MNANVWIRQGHRGLAIVFTVTIIATFIALGQNQALVWVAYVPLFPLTLLLLSGLYLFVLPYALKRRRARHVAHET